MPNPASGPRQHFGVGSLSLRRETSVFINCPFDEQFAPVFDAIVLATVCCGFMPRSALESGSTSIPRMERITRALFSSKYSIHDFSRCRGENQENLARFNMPLEFGIAMAQRFIEAEKGVDERDRHDWLLLVPGGHQYKKFVSDLSGYDPKEYDGSKEKVVPAVMLWLSTRLETEFVPDTKAVLTALKDFENRKAELLDKWVGEVPWADLVLAAQEITRKIAL